MERVHAVSEKPVSEIEGIAVAIYRNGRHLGLLHKHDVHSEAPVIKLLHHGWREPLSNDLDTSKCAFWIAPNLRLEFGKLMAGYCRLVYSRNKEKIIPFGFGRVEGSFNELWELSGEATSIGLTCVTFVLAVFHRAGAPLVNCASWPVREDDTPQLEFFVSQLRMNPEVTEYEIQVQENAIKNGQVRFRPMEIAGAASAETRPVQFAQAVELAKQLAEEFTKMR